MWWGLYSTNELKWLSFFGDQCDSHHMIVKCIQEIPGNTIETKSLTKSVFKSKLHLSWALCVLKSLAVVPSTMILWMQPIPVWLNTHLDDG